MIGTIRTNNEKHELVDANGKVITSSLYREHILNKIANPSPRIIKSGLRAVNDNGTLIALGSNGTSKMYEPHHTKFDINKRFNIMTNMVKMVSTGLAESLMITGEGGIGKSFTCMETLRKAGLKEDKDYIVVKGYSTPKALYATLYENRHSLIIFDDCDSVLKDDTSLNILKGALDSFGDRKISWLVRGFIDDGLPSSFVFEGQVIFISNLTQNKIDQAVRSRSMLVDLGMTLEDKLARMEAILPQAMPEYDLEIKQEVFDFLSEHAHIAKDFNMRTLIKAVKIRIANPESWEEMTEYMLTA